MKKMKKIRTERLMQFFLLMIGILSALLLEKSLTASITIAVLGSAVVTLVATAQVLNYKEWRPTKPSTFWCVSSGASAVALLVLLALMLMKVSFVDRTSMIAILPSVTPIIGVLIANIIRVFKKKEAVFIV